MIIKKCNSLTNLDKMCGDEKNINKWNLSCNDVKYECDDIDFSSGDYYDILNNNESLLKSSIDSYEECNICRVDSTESLESKQSSKGSSDNSSDFNRYSMNSNKSKKNNIKNVIYINNVIENIKIFKDTSDIKNIKEFNPFTNRYRYNKPKNTNKYINNHEYLCY
jgi:hypothetical protein